MLPKFEMTLLTHVKRVEECMLRVLTDSMSKFGIFGEPHSSLSLIGLLDSAWIVPDRYQHRGISHGQ